MLNLHDDNLKDHVVGKGLSLISISMLAWRMLSGTGTSFTL
jgi:hypothetical protein